MNSRATNRKYIVFIILILVISCVSACQPTPQKEIVINKNDGELIKVIEDTANYESPQVPKSTYIEEDFFTQNSNVHFRIDADVTFPKVNELPVVYINPKNISQDLADRVLNILIGNNVLYKKTDEKVKSQVEKEIESIQYNIENVYPEYKQSDPDEYEYLINRDTDYLKKLYILLETAPELPNEIASRYFDAPDLSKYAGENEPLIENGSLTQEEVNEIENNAFTGQQIIEGIADLGKADFARIEIFKYSEVNQGVWFKNGEVDKHFVYEKTVDGIDEQKALQIAIDTIKNIGIEGFRICHKGYAVTFDGGRDNQQYAYNFLFKRVINDVMVSYIGESKYKSDSTRYSEPWGDETIQVIVDDSGILFFKYRNPIIIDETANENVKVLPFEQVLEIFQNQMKIGYAFNDDEHILEQSVTIDRIELGLSRIARQNHQGFMFVPAWNFYGYETYTYDEQQPGGWQLDENNQVELKEYATSFLTINAIDGSLINKYLGY